MPFSYDATTQEFTFRPQLTDPVGTKINQSAQFYFADFPGRIWNVPIQLLTEDVSILPPTQPDILSSESESQVLDFGFVSDPYFEQVGRSPKAFICDLAS